jgi:hypothetical protein
MLSEYFRGCDLRLNEPDASFDDPTARHEYAERCSFAVRSVFISAMIAPSANRTPNAGQGEVSDRSTVSGPTCTEGQSRCSTLRVL